MVRFTSIKALTILPESKEGLMELSMHPPHMTDSEGTILPSSFLPFCAYQTMKLGEKREDIPITSCSQATATILAGQLCYSIDVSQITNTTSAKGRQNSLLLLLDVGTSTNSKTEKINKQLKWTNETKSVDIATSGKDTTSAKVFIQTLSEISNFGAGSYAMSALKHIIGSKSFMEFPNHLKECQEGSLEECHNINYFEKLQERCQCIPWGLPSFNPLYSEVNLREGCKKKKILFSKRGGGRPLIEVTLPGIIVKALGLVKAFIML